ncbi:MULTISPECIES: WhiB family transcriptional regulator [unclassified Streptomyces]|uniref:WhiB family transcriptional regulator n=1 Tax=unclassified Streptomyces TaxID=2593676 RepID=UPI002E763912|nr:WhiB family transcriptional regulator [Streptomyces sp. SP18ES09]MEE1820595.1 WhiB family transcriptional regulator [Streptomyces sp. SP18ES09]
MDGWRTAAACQEVDPDLFFPVGIGPAALAQAEDAKEICRICPVREECLRWAMEEPHPPSGVWGGLTETERTSLRRRSRRAAERRR